MKPKTDEIADTLRTEILSGQYRPGERLPSERDLAARFDANRSSVREAIKKLEQLGIADVQPGGVRIVAVEDATLEVLGYLMDLDEFPRPALIEQLFDVLSAMMALSARSAITGATDEQADTLHSMVKALIAAVDEPETYHEGWQKLGEYFHSINQNLVAKLIGNGLKTQFVGRLQTIGIRPELDYRRDLQLLDSMQDAITHRNPDAMADAMTSHFQLLKQGLLTALNKQTSQTQRRSINA